MSNIKNYMEQGGDKFVIGGTLEITEEGEILGFPSATNQADSTSATVEDLKADLNALLAKLKAAGLMANDA
jgi:hypothetical protein